MAEQTHGRPAGGELGLTFVVSFEGERAVRGGVLLGTIYSPSTGKDYWARSERTGALLKGLRSVESARAALASLLEAEAPQPVDRKSEPVSARDERAADRLARTIANRTVRPRKETKARKTSRPTGPVRPLPFRCPVCDVPLRYVKRHIEKVHPDQVKRLSDFIKKSSPHSGPPPAKRKRNHKARQGDGGLPVPVWVDQMVAECRVSLAGNVRIRCPKCRMGVREDELRQHLIRAHLKPRKPVGSKPPKAPGSRNRKVEYPDQVERRHDASRDHGKMFREHGRFGSFPAHDGFGEEDRP